MLQNKHYFYPFNVLTIFAMLTRRHIRVKTMQALYAFDFSKDDNLIPYEKQIAASSKGFYELYLMLLSMLVEVRSCGYQLYLKNKKQYLPASKDQLNSKFFNNIVLINLSNDKVLEDQMDRFKLRFWKQHDEYVRLIWNQVAESNVYKNYIHNQEQSFKSDLKFVEQLFVDVIAPFERLYEFLEETKISWIDDLPLVNTIVLKSLMRISQKNDSSVVLKELYKFPEDKDFGLNLFRKTVLNNDKLLNEVEGKTPNWEQDRIGNLDLTLIKMGIAELLYFPSIPVKVTINEYLEIAKEYATPKSSYFINGVLDNLSKEFQTTNRLNKNLRGLQ